MAHSFLIQSYCKISFKQQVEGVRLKAETDNVSVYLEDAVLPACFSAIISIFLISLEKKIKYPEPDESHPIC